MRSPWAIRPRAIVLGMLCVTATAALIAARQPSHRGDVASAEAQPDASAPLDKVAMVPRLETKKPVVSQAPATAAAARKYPADLSIEHTKALDSVKATAVESASRAPALESAPKAAAVESTSSAGVQNLAPVTITGCLALDAETFWLKDTSGADAPTSRGWRSGFLKKRPAAIELVDADNTLNLPNHVGQRVAATGTLMNREMRAHSLQSVGAFCS